MDAADHLRLTKMKSAAVLILGKAVIGKSRGLELRETGNEDNACEKPHRRRRTCQLDTSVSVLAAAQGRCLNHSSRRIAATPLMRTREDDTDMTSSPARQVRREK
jgi:hypothetical protein